MYNIATLYQDDLVPPCIVQPCPIPDDLIVPHRIATLERVSIYLPWGLSINENKEVVNVGRDSIAFLSGIRKGDRINTVEINKLKYSNRNTIIRILQTEVKVILELWY